MVNVIMYFEVYLTSMLKETSHQSFPAQVPYYGGGELHFIPIDFLDFFALLRFSPSRIAPPPRGSRRLEARLSAWIPLPKAARGLGRSTEVFRWLDRPERARV